MSRTDQATPPHVIVTGGSSGIGRAVVERFLGSQGARCSIIDLEGGQEFDGDVRTFTCDVTDQDAVAAAVEEACRSAGPPAGLVTCAGIVSRDATMEIDGNTWRRILQVHLDGTLFACQAAARQMRKVGEGSIVTLGSVAMDFGVPGRAAYGAAKAAIRSLTSTLACEWADYGIRVNCVAPGDVRTPMYDELLDHGAFDEASVRESHALGRPAEPAEIATVIEFLLSDNSSFMTGEIVRVDGGLAIKKL